MLKRNIIFDMYMENNRYNGKYLRKDLDIINDKIKDIENAIDELSLQEDMQKRVNDKVKLLKQVNEELKSLIKKRDQLMSVKMIFLKFSY